MESICSIKSLINWLKIEIYELEEAIESGVSLDIAHELDDVCSLVVTLHTVATHCTCRVHPMSIDSLESIYSAAARSWLAKGHTMPAHMPWVGVVPMPRQFSERIADIVEVANKREFDYQLKIDTSRATSLASPTTHSDSVHLDDYGAVVSTIDFEFGGERWTFALRHSNDGRHTFEVGYTDWDSNEICVRLDRPTNNAVRNTILHEYAHMVLRNFSPTISLDWSANPREQEELIASALGAHSVKLDLMMRCYDDYLKSITIEPTTSN